MNRLLIARSLRRRKAISDTLLTSDLVHEAFLDALDDPFANPANEGVAIIALNRKTDAKPLIASFGEMAGRLPKSASMVSENCGLPRMRGVARSIRDFNSKLRAPGKPPNSKLAPAPAILFSVACAGGALRPSLL